MTLTNEQRKEVWIELQEDWSRTREVLDALTKEDLRAAVDALDDWFDANATAVNTTIPQPARGELATKQKAMLFAFVLLKRYKVI